MPKKFPVVLAWFDGNFSPLFEGHIISQLRPDLSSADKIEYRQKMRHELQRLAIGLVTAEEFSRISGDICQVKINPSLFPSMILKSLEMNQAFIDIFTYISKNNETRVVVDIPNIWFRQIVKNWNMESVFIEKQLIFLEKSNLQQFFPDVFSYIPDAAGAKKEDCFVIDPWQMRAVAAHKSGLTSTAFVYPRRLKIDLALQGIWQTDEDVYHPKAGARTSI